MRHSIRQRTSVRSISAIRATVTLDRQEAATRIMREVERSRGRVRYAAIALGCNRRTLERIIFELDLWPQVEACRDRWTARRRDPLQLKGPQTCSANQNSAS